MARMRKRYRTGIALLAMAVVATSGIAAASPAPAPSGASTGLGNSVLGVVGSADGWLTYTNTLAGTLALGNAHTTTLAGHRSADGSCAIGSGASAATPRKAGGTARFTEEVAYNPRTCQERVLTGDLTASAAAQLNAMQPAGSAPTTATATAPAQASRNGGGVSPATTYYESAYTKTAWIDPLDITITSLANNLTWPLYGAAGTLTATAYAYEFPYDGWSSSGITFSPFYSFNSSYGPGWYIHAYDHFTNNDFAALVYALSGLAGWLACGAQFTTTAHFNHDVSVYGYSNDYRNRAWNDEVDGACADLVHHGEWDGFGTTQ